MKAFFWKLNFLVLILMASFHSAQARPLLSIPTPTCDQIVVHGVTASYCIYVHPNQDVNPNLLYFFHGAGGTPRQWDQESQGVSAQDLYYYWGGGLFEQSRVPPTVISISFGPYWQFSDWDSGNGVPLMRDIFVNELMPLLETKVAFHSGQRFAAGTSMGGMNSIYLWLRSGKLFTKIAALCPSLLDISPYSDSTQLQSYAESTPGATVSGVSVVANILKTIFPTPDSWSNNQPKLYLNSSLSPSTLSDSFVIYSDSDELGLGPAVTKFVNLAQSGSYPLSLEETGETKHCRNIFTQELADYLVPPLGN